MPPNFEELLSPSFAPAVRRRGLQAYNEGAVEGVQLSAGRATARVRGLGRHDARLLWEPQGGPERLRAGCNCPGFRERGPCEHVWALVLELDEREVPPPGGTRAASGDSGAPRPLWLQRVDRIERAAPPAFADPWPRLAPDALRLRVEIDLDRSRSARALVLRAAFRRRNQEGAFGALQPLERCAKAELAGFEATERALLARLHGAEHGGGLYEPRCSAVFQLDGELAHELVPALCDAERLFAEGEDAPPLRFDPGEPFVATFALERDASRGEVELACALRRGDERIDPSGVALLLDGAGLLLAGDRFARCELRGSRALVEEIGEHGPVRAPFDEERAFLERVAGLAGGAEVAGPDELALAAPALVPQLVVSARAEDAELEPGEERERAPLDCRIRFDYGALAVELGDLRPCVLRARDGRLVRRDAGAERAALARFLASGGRHGPEDRAHRRDGTVEVAALPRLLRELVGAGWKVEAEGRLCRAPGALRFCVRSGVDWLELRGELEFGGERAELPDLLRALRAGRTRVLLRDGSSGILPERGLEGLALLDAAGHEEHGGLRFAHRQAWLVDALLSSREEVEWDAELERLRARMKRGARSEEKREPASFRGSLRAYQRRGLAWFEEIAELGLGGCLADDMGLGKTVQVLALFEARRRARDERDVGPQPSLVVAPRSLVFNWLEEARRFAPELRALDYTGAARKERFAAIDEADLVVTTYGTLRRDAPELSTRRFDYVVLDEAQAIKNGASLNAKAARVLDARHRLALSGTPIENHLGELWSLFEFLNPGMLGRSSSFRRAVRGERGERGEPDAEEAALVARALRPFFLRRTKREVLPDLPEKTEQTLYCELGPRQRRDYEELRSHYRASLLGAGVEGPGAQVLEALLRLRQAACHPGLLDPTRAREGSAKLETLLPRLEELVTEGHRGLVFSQFTRMLDLVGGELDARGLAFERLDGKTRDRQAGVRRFQSGAGAPLFLISLKAGGAGLNLTAADHVFLLDPWWNPAAEAQAIDRAHRMGRQRPVCAYRLIARGTVEERVLELQAAKRELAESVLGEAGGPPGELSREDLERLLS